MRAAAFRLARADLFARPGQTALTAFAIFAAATALVVTLALRAGLDEPFADAMDADQRRARRRLRRADRRRRGDARGPARGGGRGVEPRANVRAAARRRVRRRRAGGPAGPTGSTAARDRGPPSATAAEVLVERSFAREEGLRVGDSLDARRHGYTIAGLAVTTQQATYPRWRPGIVWAPGVTSSRRRVGVRLADPEAIEAYVAAARQALPDAGCVVTDWHDVRDTITDQTRTYSLIISINTLLALFAVGFTVATVISGRVLAQRREIGLMKAVGFSPRGVVALLVGEYLAIALAAGAARPDRGRADRAAAAASRCRTCWRRHAERVRPVPLLASLALILLAVAVFTADPRPARRAREHRRRARARPRRRRDEGVARRAAGRGAPPPRPPPGSASRTRSRAARARR